MPGPVSCPPAPERKYNFIYEKLVQGPDDIIGLIAYGLYKRKKIEYIKGFTDRRGHGPSEEGLAEFCEMSCQHLAEYRRDAETSMAEAFRMIYEDDLARVQLDSEDELKERLKGSFWRSVGSSVMGSFVTALAIGLVLVAIVGFRYGLDAAWKVLTLETPPPAVVYGPPREAGAQERQSQGSGSPSR